LVQRRKFLSDETVADLLERVDDSDDDVGALSASEDDTDDGQDDVMQEETVEVVEDGNDDRIVLTPPPGTSDPLRPRTPPSPGSQDLFIQSPAESLPSPSASPPAKRRRVEPTRPVQVVLSDNSGRTLTIYGIVFPHASARGRGGKGVMIKINQRAKL
jgi:hypothetical protein